MPAGYVEMKPNRVVPLQDSGALLLVDLPSNSVVPIFIGGTEAQSIMLRLDRKVFKRPLTHDLLDHLMQQLHATLVKVQIDELQDEGDGGTYIGSIFVRANGRVFKLDARPSDAIALAIGAHVPIYVARSVIDKTGMKWDELLKEIETPPAAPGQGGTAT